MRIELPYGKNGKVTAEIPDERLVGIIEPKEIASLPSKKGKIEDALLNPIGSDRLSKIVKQNDKVTIIVTDISRPCPDDRLVPAILRELDMANVRKDQVTMIVANGSHRPMTDQELKEKVGEEVFEKTTIINHVCTDQEDLKFIGKTPNLDIPLSVNKEIINTNMLISTGMVDTHIFAGYAGNGKSVMPGVSAIKTIEGMHRPELLDNPNVGVCLVDRNPVHLDIVEAARKADLRFIVNVILNGKGEIAKAAAGDMVRAHGELVRTMDDCVKVPIQELPDIVVSCAGYPKDRDLYQATRAANNFVCGPTPAIKKGGVIIIPAPCEDGVGSKTFYEWMKDARNLDEILERGKKEPTIGAHRPYIMAKILKRASVIIVGSKIPGAVEEMKMSAIKTMDEALEMSLKKTGKKAKILVSPHGTTTVPIFKTG